MSWKRNILFPILLLLVVSAFVFVPFNGNVHLFDKHEISFAESAREMLETENYATTTINYNPVREKPPLFIWMQMLSMKAFGMNEFAARFPNALAGFFTLLALFFAGRSLFDQKFGSLWVVTYLASMLPLLYFKSGIIDPWFNLFIFLSVVNYGQLYYTKKTVNKTRKILLSGVFIALAVLTKGPVAIVMLGIVALVLWLVNQFKIPFNLTQVALFLFAIGLVGGAWLIWQINEGNPITIRDIFTYQIRLFQSQNAEQGGFLMYHWVVLLVGMFPVSIYALRGFATIQGNSMNQIIFKQTMIILLFSVLIIFSIVKTKMIHYSSLAYFPVTFLAAYAVYKMGNNTFRNRRWVPVLTTFIGVFIATLTILVTLIAKNKLILTEYFNINDSFALANLDADVFWSGNEWLVGCMLLIGLVVYNFIASWNYLFAYRFLLFISIVFTLLSLTLYVPKIEEYTQRSAIEFYKKKAHEDCYVTTVGFKSYAHLFYSRKKYPENPDALNKSWLLTGDVDKPVYVVSKINKMRFLKMHFPTLIFLYEKNGYVFCRRNRY